MHLHHLGHHRCCCCHPLLLYGGGTTVEGSRDGHDVTLCDGKLFVGGNVM